MFKYLTILFFAFPAFCMPLHAQEQTYSHDDTLQAIQYMESYVQEHPNDRFAFLSVLALSDLEMSAGQYEPARVRLAAALDTEISPGFGGDNYDSRYMFMIDILQYNAVKFQICMRMGDIYLKRKDAGKAMEYAQMADSTHFGRYSCGNEADGARMQAYMLKNECNLLAGDTTKVINNLLDCLNYWGVGILPAKRLRLLLLERYSPGDINKEIDRAINNIQITMQSRDGKTAKQASITLFGHPVNISYSTDKKIIKKYLEKNWFLNTLRT